MIGDGTLEAGGSMGRYIGVFTTEDGINFETEEKTVTRLVTKAKLLARGKKIVKSQIVWRESGAM